MAKAIRDGAGTIFPAAASAVCYYRTVGNLIARMALSFPRRVNIVVAGDIEFRRAANQNCAYAMPLQARGNPVDALSIDRKRSRRHRAIVRRSNDEPSFQLSSV